MVIKYIFASNRVFHINLIPRVVLTWLLHRCEEDRIVFLFRAQDIIPLLHKQNGGLGSCVGVALYDPVTKVSGLLHCMLPDSTQIRNNSNVAKFADTGIDELIYPADNPKDCLNTVGYELKDINNDDTDELFIADKDNIYAIYTVKNDKAVLVTEGWIRNRNYLLNDNIIFNEGSGGAANNMFGTYRLNSGATELEPLDIYYSDFIDESNQTVGWFYSKGSDEYNDGSLTGMTLDDATKLCDEYLAEKADLNLIYLINYIPSN